MAGRASVDSDLPFLDLAPADDVAPGVAKSYDLEDRRVLLCNVDGELHAVDDVCSHDEGPLGEGKLRGTQVECPRHGACFDVTDGSVQEGPAVRKISSFPLRVRDGRVQVQLVEAPKPKPDPRGPGGLGFLR